jgi:hypothetical protein
MVSTATFGKSIFIQARKYMSAVVEKVSSSRIEPLLEMMNFFRSSFCCDVSRKSKIKSICFMIDAKPM